MSPNDPDFNRADFELVVDWLPPRAADALWWDWVEAHKSLAEAMSAQDLLIETDGSVGAVRRRYWVRTGATRK